MLEAFPARLRRGRWRLFLSPNFHILDADGIGAHSLYFPTLRFRFFVDGGRRNRKAENAITFFNVRTFLKKGHGGQAIGLPKLHQPEWQHDP